MTHDELKALLQDANECAARYLETGSNVDRAMWLLAAWRIGFRAECAEMQQRARQRLEERTQ